MRSVLSLGLASCLALSVASEASASPRAGVLRQARHSYVSLKRELLGRTDREGRARTTARLLGRLKPWSLRKRWRGEHEKGFERRGKQRRPIRYLWTDAERAPHEVEIRDGRLFHAPQPGAAGGSTRPFGTGKSETLVVMDLRGRIYAREAQPGDADRPDKWAHSSFTAGGPVLMALEITAVDGKVIKVKNRSGHYRPSRLAFVRWLLLMESRGLDLSAAEVVFDRKSDIR